MSGRRETVRLFVAIELPGGLRSAVGRRVRELRDDFPRARWVPPANLHLTLEFLGGVPRARVEPLVESLADAIAGCSTFSLALRSAGVFPPRGPARVLWLGVDAGRSLADLQAKVSRAVRSELASLPPARPWAPHLTVGRARRPWPRRAAERWCDAVDRDWGPPVEVHGVALLESRLTPSGARYSEVAGFGLEDASGTAMRTSSPAGRITEESA